MLPPIPGIFLVLSILGILIGTMWAISRVRPVEAELSRKVVHIGMGLIVLTFPWIFQRTWPVFVLALLAIGSLMLLRVGRLRTEGPGKVLLGVERSSLGDIYFPLSVALLFYLAHGNWLLYCIPLLILTLADAFAALIGRRWGRLKYTTSGGHKSYEGSLAFFVVAFFSIVIPLIRWGQIPIHSAMIIGAIIGIIVSALEGISLSGRDNLYIPFAVFILLKAYLPVSVDVLGFHLIVLLASFGLVLLFRTRTTLDDAALVGAVLTAFAAYVIGGWPWIVPPFLVLLGYTRMYPHCYPEGRGFHNIHAVVSVTAGGYLALLLFSESGKSGWYLPYAISYGNQLAMIGVASLATTFPGKNLMLLTAKAAGIASGAIVALLYAVGYFYGREVPLLACLATLVLCSTAAFVFAGWQARIRDCPVDTTRWIRQAVIGIALSLPAIIVVEFEK